MWFALKMAFRESYQKIPITFMLNTNFSANTAIYITLEKDIKLARVRILTQ